MRNYKILRVTADKTEATPIMFECWNNRDKHWAKYAFDGTSYKSRKYALRAKWEMAADDFLEARIACFEDDDLIILTE